MSPPHFAAKKSLAEKFITICYFSMILRVQPLKNKGTFFPLENNKGIRGEPNWQKLYNDGIKIRLK